MDDGIGDACRTTLKWLAERVDDKHQHMDNDLTTQLRLHSAMLEAGFEISRLFVMLESLKDHAKRDGQMTRANQLREDLAGCAEMPKVSLIQSRMTPATVNT